MRYFLLSSTIFVQNRQSETLLKEIKELFRLHLGRMNIGMLGASIIVVLLGIKEYMRCRLFGDARTPKTSYRSFNKAYKHVERMAKLSEAVGAKPSIVYSIPEQNER